MATAKKYIAGCCNDCAQRKAYLSQLQPESWVSISNDEDIRGLRNKKVFVCQQLRNRREGFELIKRMQSQGFNLSFY